MRTDVLLLVPFEPDMNMLFDEHIRRTTGARIYLPLLEAHAELEAYVGRKLEVEPDADGNCFGEPPVTHRSLGAVALATHLERAGLRWQVCDPGVVGLAYWRDRLERAKVDDPRVVAISTTFVMKTAWLRTICAIVRRTLPRAKIAVGGYFYATDAEGFLSLDADVFCVGEGEARLPALVQALKAGDGEELAKIPGLYLRQPNGDLLYTGRAEAMELGSLPTPDWQLASRIDPPVDLENDVLMHPVETQRGCVFKCEFCTFRTLSELSVMSAARAAEEIVASAAARRGMINLADATATVPHARWDELMQLLIDRGGSPLPISCFARVADIDDRKAELMAKAGVRLLFVGQESADQQLLNRMKKGTKVSQIRPALEACARHGIGTYFSFLHGFPGETRDSIEATRGFIATLNRGHEQRPVCFTYALNPFQVYDLATVSQQPVMESASHYLAYETPEFTSVQISEQVLQTMIIAGRADGAPVPMEVLNLVRLSRAASVFSGPQRYEAFHWLRAVYRGMTLLLERQLEGTRPNEAELARLRQRILALYPAQQRPGSAFLVRARSAGKRAFLRRLAHEWKHEPERGVGPVTRTLLTALLVRGLGSVPEALRTAERVLAPTQSAPPPTRTVRELASNLIELSLAPRRRPVRAAAAAR